MMTPLQKAAQDVIDSWDSPQWNDAIPTIAIYFMRLREALKAEQSQMMEPVNFTTGHCKEKSNVGGCQLHNLQCGYPACDKKSISCQVPTSEGSTVKTNERAELVARLFECLRITTLTTREATAIKDAADMLEADAQWRSMYEQREDEAHELSEQIIKLQAQQAQQAADDEYYLIFFADADCRPEIFNSRSAALHRYEQVSTSWNAHLFVRLDSNSRGSSPPVQQVAVPAGCVLVPIEPTEEMLKAARNAPMPAVWLDSISARANLASSTQYKAMLSAAPQPPKEIINDTTHYTTNH